MKPIAVLLGLLLCAAAPLAQAQVSNLSLQVQQRLAEVGPGWGKDILGNIEKTLEVFTPVLAAAPKSGINITRDVAYGADARHKLDLFRGEGIKGAPVVVFLHGGAYVRGERNLNPEAYGNVAMYFARQGMLGVNATYRLAPAAQWPAAAQYPARSPINHVKNAVRVPTFLVIAEYNNPDLDTQGALLLGALCERDRSCPRFIRMEKHNHLSMVFQFNTADDALGRDVLEFIKRGR